MVSLYRLGSWLVNGSTRKELGHLSDMKFACELLYHEQEGHNNEFV